MTQEQTRYDDMGFNSLLFANFAYGKQKNSPESITYHILIIAPASTIDNSHSAHERWSRYFPQSTSTLTTSRHKLPTPIKELSSINANEKLVDILRYLGLTKMQLKDICRVSRQTLYDWMASKFEPEGKNSTRLNSIHELALLVPSNSNTPIRAKLLNQSIVEDKSLLHLLQEKNLNLPLLREGLMALVRKSKEMKQRSARASRERLGFSLPDSDTQKVNQLINLDGQE